MYAYHKNHVHMNKLKLWKTLLMHQYQSVLFLYILVLLLFQEMMVFCEKHSQTRICINDTRLIQSNNHVWGNVSHLEPSDNYLNPAAQFRVRDNDAMLK